METYTSHLQRQIATAHDNATNTLSVARSLYREAQNVSTQAMNVPLLELQGKFRINIGIPMLYFFPYRSCPAIHI